MNTSWKWICALVAACTFYTYANAVPISGSFSGIVPDGFLERGTRASGTFLFETEPSPFGQRLEFPGEVDLLDQDVTLTFTIDDMVFEPLGSTSVLLLDNGITQTLLLRAGEPVGGSGFVSLSGAAGALFRNFDLDTFNPAAIDIGNSQAGLFFLGAPGADIQIDQISIRGFGTIGVSEPASICLFAIALLCMLVALACMRGVAGRSRGDLRFVQNRS